MMREISDGKGFLIFVVLLFAAVGCSASAVFSEPAFLRAAFMVGALSATLAFSFYVQAIRP